MAYRLSDDWEVMAKKLGLDQSVTKEIKDTQKFSSEPNQTSSKNA